MLVVVTGGAGFVGGAVVRRLRARGDEVVAASAGVTYWFSAAKAAAELGFVARDLEQGFRDTFGAD